MSHTPKSRTEWAERKIEELLSLPFIAEYVFRSPKKLDTTEKEVADLLLVHKGEGVLVSQKMQEEPGSRTERKNELWVRKNAKAAASQLFGAIRSANQQSIWCDHPRLGRVTFSEGLPTLRHGIVIVETWTPVDLQVDELDLALTYEGVPITYMSVNDFVNLALQLRTVPELFAYLDARRNLPIPCLRVVGDEKCLLEMYLLEGGTLAGCIGHSDAKLVVASRHSELSEILQRKTEYDASASYLEYVADALATRHPDTLSGLPPVLVAAFDPSKNRTRYLAMQEVLCDLKLRERAEIGQALLNTSKNLSSETQGMKFCSIHFDTQDRVWVLSASKNIDRITLLRRMNALTHGAMAFYQKQSGMFILDRDGVSFEVGLSRPGYQPSENERDFGTKMFGNLKVTDTFYRLI